MEYFTSSLALVKKIPVTTGASFAYTSLYSIGPVTDIKQGDLLQLTAAFEVLSTYTQYVMLCSYMVLTSSPSDPVGITRLDEAGGGNFSVAEHHPQPHRARQWLADKDYPGDNYINLVVYAAYVNALPGWTIAVQTPQYGHVDCVITRATP